MASIMDDPFQRKLLIGLLTSFVSMVLAACIVLIGLVIRKKFKESRQLPYLTTQEVAELSSPGRRTPRARTGTRTYASPNNDPESLINGVAFSTKSFRSQGSTGTLMDMPSAYTPPLQPLHNSNTNPFGDRPPYRSGYMDITNPARPQRTGSPAPVAFRDSRLPATRVDYEQGRVRIPQRPGGDPRGRKISEVRQKRHNRQNNTGEQERVFKNRQTSQTDTDHPLYTSIPNINSSRESSAITVDHLYLRNRIDSEDSLAGYSIGERLGTEERFRTQTSDYWSLDNVLDNMARSQDVDEHHTSIFTVDAEESRSRLNRERGTGISEVHTRFEFEEAKSQSGGFSRLLRTPLREDGSLSDEVFY